MIQRQTNGSSSRLSRTQSGLLFELEEGRFAASHRLPSERDLAALLGVSRTTLRKALAELIAQGRIEQRQGFGTFVVREPTPSSAASEGMTPDSALDASPGAELLQRGELAESRELTTGIFRPTAEETMMLGLAPDLWVRRSSRLWFSAEQHPLAHEMTAISAENPAGRPADHGKAGLEPRWIERRIRRVRASPLESKIAASLLLKENTIGIVLEERAFALSGACVAFTRLCRPLFGFDLAYEFRPGPNDVANSA